MCGIAGVIKLAGSVGEADLARLQKALLAQAHRGPDARSSWSDHLVAFGHNRLSIIDLSTAANQPFHRKDLRLSIVFNGEIYNYQSLKKLLEHKGYTFQTTSDTEVLLVAYREFGKELTKHLVGMFAFVIYDEASEEVFAARDRFGEKPFYFIQTEDAFYFASELNALRQLFPGPLTLNQEAVVDLLENMYINLHHTIYNEIQVFQPANQLLVRNGNLEWMKYYDFQKKTDRKPGFEALRSQVREELFEIVEKELHADVPVATFLSSGIDSSLITAISKEIKPDILAITMSTGEKVTDEARDASRFAKKLAIRQEVITANPGSLEVLSQLLKHMQPLADASLIPTHLVTKSVASHTKVMLSGDAGDEVFGSYNKPNLFKKFGQNPIPFGKWILDGFSLFPPRFSEKYLSDKNRFKLAGWNGYYFKNNLTGTFSRVFRDSSPLEQVRKVSIQLLPEYSENPEKLSFGVDALTRLPGDFLLKVDSAAMYSSLEVRAPFLDHKLVDLAFSADMDSLSPNGIDKEITRSLYKEFAGKEHQGSKKGFSIPYLNYLTGSWGLILEQYLLEGLSEEHFRFNKSGILELLKEFRKVPGQRLARILFSILVLEIWLRVFHLKREVDFQLI